MKIRKIVVGYVVFVFSGTVVAQGVFDFDDIPGVDQEPAISVDINPTVMGFIRTMAGAADPEAADVLSGLRSIRVRVYHDGDNTREFNNFIDDVTEELEDNGWDAIVSSQDEGSRIRVHMQMTEEEVTGMTFMVTDGLEAFFINVDGTISAEDIGKVLAALPLDDALGAFNFPIGLSPSAPTVDADAD